MENLQEYMEILEDVVMKMVILGSLLLYLRLGNLENLVMENLQENMEILEDVVLKMVILGSLLLVELGSVVELDPQNLQILMFPVLEYLIEMEIVVDPVLKNLRTLVLEEVLLM